MANWVIGGTGSRAGRVPETDMHIVLIVASDDREHLRAEVDWIKASIDQLPGSTGNSRHLAACRLFSTSRGPPARICQGMSTSGSRTACHSLVSVGDCRMPGRIS